MAVPGTPGAGSPKLSAVCSQALRSGAPASAASQLPGTAAWRAGLRAPRLSRERGPQRVPESVDQPFCYLGGGVGVGRVGVGCLLCPFCWPTVPGLRWPVCRLECPRKGRPRFPVGACTSEHLRFRLSPWLAQLLATRPLDVLLLPRPPVSSPRVAASFAHVSSLPAEPSHADRPDSGAGLRGVPQAEPAAHAAERGRPGGRGQRVAQPQLRGPR